MNFKSHGPGLVAFVIAALFALVGIAGADIQGGPEAAAPDNDDNPHVSHAVELDADDRLLTSREKTRIAAAAIQAVGSGTATDMEASDDAGTAYEAEVHDRAGIEWEVELDAKFAVVSKSKDS